MKNTTIPGLILLLLSLFSACSKEVQKAPDEFLLKGEFANYSEQMLYVFKLMPDRSTLIDSVLTNSSGEFSLLGKAELGRIFQLRTANHRSITIYPEQDVLSIHADYENMAAYTVSGNIVSQKIGYFVRKQYSLYKDYIKKKRVLNVVNKNLDLKRWREKEALADHALMDYREFLTAYIDTVPEPVLAGYAMLSLNEKGNFYYIQKTIEGLRKKLKGSLYLEDLYRRFRQHGDGFVAFEGQDIEGAGPNGETYSLWSLRGKIVVMYYWASYCEFSRSENRRFAALKEVLEENDIKIFAYSIDDDESAWKQAIEEDGLGFAVNIRGNSGWDSKPFSHYAVQSIPTTYLLDARGIIRSKNLRAGELDKDLEMIVKAHSASSSK